MSSEAGERSVIAGIIVACGLVLGFLVWILYFKRTTGEYSDAVAMLPAINAGLNALSASCVTSGFIAIRRKRWRIHMSFMITAFLFSALFLAGYIVYHSLHGDTKFTGTGSVRTLYFTILISHIVCTPIALPLILTTFYFALTKKFSRHKKIARIVLPIWLYVSVTGVVIFFMLRAHS